MGYIKMRGKQDKNKKSCSNREPEATICEDRLEEDGVGTQKKDDMRENEKSELTKALAELSEYKDKYLRLCAEFDNARKRMEREKQEFVKYANEGILLDVVGLLDNLERSLVSINTAKVDVDALIKGINMVISQVRDVLSRHGVVPIEAKGKMFDPHYHEALMQEELDDVEDGTVVDEFQKGYFLNGRLLRTAKVKVAKRSGGELKGTQSKGMGKEQQEKHEDM